MKTEALGYRVDGPATGEPVLLLNGGMMTIPSWDPIAERLAAEHSVVRCDFRGQLMSPGPPPPDLEGHADDVVALLDEIESAQVHVVGASFGAEVGLMLAADHPRRVRSVVAITASDVATDGMAEGAERLRAACRDILAGGDRGQLHDLLWSEVFSDGWREAHVEELARRRERMAELPDAWFHGLEGLLRALDGFDLRPQLDRIVCPALVVLASDDRVVPEARGRALARAVAGAELEIVHGAGHALVVEQPDRLARVLLGFLSSERHR